MKYLNIDHANKIIDEKTTVFWFRRDLRLGDNAGLYHALKSGRAVIPIFIFDPNILDTLNDKGDKRIDFIHQSLALLQEKLKNMESSLVVLYGDPIAVFKKLKPHAVYTNDDYEPYARRRDTEIRQLLEAGGSAFHSFKDQVIFEKEEVIKEDGEPYTIFTPYSKKWQAKLNKFYVKSYPTEKYLANFKKVNPLPFPSLPEIGFKETQTHFPPRVIPLGIIQKYDQQRNFPALHGTTRLSVHLRFGTVSIRNLIQIALKKNKTWLKELIWRDFYQMILWHFPVVETKSFKPAYDLIRWRNDPNEFQSWCAGQTGYPIVDAGMRELNATGFMHNRVRMITASFLTKHLLIDWRWGEAYFAEKLLDFDLASNNGGWQWAAGTGCDAAPYFRVFNPELQTKKFDQELIYVKKWVPEFGMKEYPAPIVDHQVARERALKAYKLALG